MRHIYYSLRLPLQFLFPVNLARLHFSHGVSQGFIRHISEDAYEALRKQ